MNHLRQHIEKISDEGITIKSYNVTDNSNDSITVCFNVYVYKQKSAGKELGTKFDLFYKICPKFITFEVYSFHKKAFIIKETIDKNDFKSFCNYPIITKKLKTAPLFENIL